LPFSFKNVNDSLFALSQWWRLFHVIIDQEVCLFTVTKGAYYRVLFISGFLHIFLEMWWFCSQSFLLTRYSWVVCQSVTFKMTITLEGNRMCSVVFI
jgi:hypothetical protein